MDEKTKTPVSSSYTSFGPQYRKEDELEVYGRRFPGFSRSEIHPAVSKMLSAYPKGTVLDLPTGAGALAWRLHNEGFKVVGGDLFPEYFQNSEIEVRKTDLNSRFPFDDNSFDYACFIEGPEHVENVFHCFREFSRVLKPGGMLFLTIPNYSNLQNRIKELLYGASEPLVSHERLLREYGGDGHMIHINRLHYPMLKMALEFANFQVVNIAKDKTKVKQNLLWPLAAFIQLLTRLRGKRGHDKYWMDETNSSMILMGGNTLILSAKALKSVT